jgi:hypothetical protein
MILRQKIIFFPILGGARAGCAPRWIRPWPWVVSSRKVSRFAPLNRYYIIKDEVFFDYFLEIIYLLVVCKKYNNSFILVYFKGLFMGTLFLSSS